MARKLIWDKEVLVQIEEVAIYIFENWGKAAAAKFIRSTQKQAKSLLKLPHLGRKSSKADDLYLINVGTYHCFITSFFLTKSRLFIFLIRGRSLRRIRISEMDILNSARKHLQFFSELRKLP